MHQLHLSAACTCLGSPHRKHVYLIFPLSLHCISLRSPSPAHMCQGYCLTSLLAQCSCLPQAARLCSHSHTFCLQASSPTASVLVMALPKQCCQGRAGALSHPLHSPLLQGVSWPSAAGQGPSGHVQRPLQSNSKQQFPQQSSHLPEQTAATFAYGMYPSGSM